MRQWAAKVRDWLSGSAQPSPAVLAYEIPCACGHLIRGVRQTKHQVIRCPDCRREIFVLPLSPLPAPAPSGEPAQSAPLADHRPARTRRRLAFAFLTALACLVIFSLIVWMLVRNPPGKGVPVAEKELATFQHHLGAGRLALDQGNFQSAADEFEAAREIWRRRGPFLPPGVGHDLTHLHEQAALLADLLTESLEEIIGRLDGLDLREGQATFARRYRGKAVVFYATVRRDPAGRFEMDYRIAGRVPKARLELSDLKLLQKLPLEEPQLLLFGARLAGVRREPDGSLVISLDPESGVLITHPGAAEACCFQPPDEAQFRATLDRQAVWVTLAP